MVAIRQLLLGFITAMTIGYGDIRPTSQLSKALSISIGLAGMLFSGILVALGRSFQLLLLSQFITQQSSGSCRADL